MAYVCSGVIPEKWPIKNADTINTNGAMKLCLAYGLIRLQQFFGSCFIAFISARSRSTENAISLNSCSTVAKGTQPRNHCNDLCASSARPLLYNQYGLSGTKNTAMNPKNGIIADKAATNRHGMNEPIMNCRQTPPMTVAVPVAVNIPRYCGCTVSAIYVNSYYLLRFFFCVYITKRMGTQ